MRFRRMLCGVVLVAEALVVLFFLLVAKDLTDVAGPVLLWGGGAVILACLLLAGLLRHRWAYAAGWVLQAALVASGLLVPAMFFLGLVFATLWWAALAAAARIERVQQQAG